MAISAGGPTVIEAWPVIPWEAAETCAVPGATPFRSPCVLMVATADGLASQVTEEVKSSSLPSENVPDAVSCRLVPAASDCIVPMTILVSVLEAAFFGAMLPPPQLTSSEIHASAVSTPRARAGRVNLMAKNGSQSGGESQRASTNEAGSSSLFIETGGCLGLRAKEKRYLG